MRRHQAGANKKTHLNGFAVVTPGPVNAVHPVSLVDLPAPALRTYPVYTLVTNKLHALAVLGMANTRLKDYFDLSFLLEREELGQAILRQAVLATFNRRGTLLGSAIPTSLRDAFSRDPSRQTTRTALRIVLARTRRITLPQACGPCNPEGKTQLP